MTTDPFEKEQDKQEKRDKAHVIKFWESILDDTQIVFGVLAIVFVIVCIAAGGVFAYQQARIYDAHVDVKIERIKGK